MNGLRAIAFTVLCVGWGAACAKHRSPEAGTNTNWLKQCDADAECDGDGDCLCGVCTKTCTARSECSPLGDRVSCTSVDEATCGASATGSVCLPEQGPPSDSGAPDSGPPDSGTSDSGTSDPDRTLIRIGAEVQIPNGLRTCTSNADCTLVDTSCNGCCEQGAIRRSDEQYFHDNFEQACSTGERGPICRCLFEPLAPRCENQLCTAVERDPLRDCYSPTQNVEQAGDPRAVGCECEQAGLVSCVADTSLICSETEMQGVLRWSFDGRGPCPNDPDCAAEARRPDADSCVAEYRQCIARPTGDFCGGGCRGVLDCDTTDCQYSPRGSIDCVPQISRWEGLCMENKIRYRYETAGLGGTTWYWDDASGQLLALTEESDGRLYCNDSEFSIIFGDFRVVDGCFTVLDGTTRICPLNE